MDGDNPSCHEIDEIVKHVSVSNAIHCGVNGDSKEKYACEVTNSGGDSGHHSPAGQGFHEKNKWHYREDIVVGREWSEPVYREIMYPNHEYGEIDRQDPQHEDKDGVGVVVEVEICIRAGFARKA